MVLLLFLLLLPLNILHSNIESNRYRLSCHVLRRAVVADLDLLWFSPPMHEYPPLLVRTTDQSSRIIDWKFVLVRKMENLNYSRKGKKKS